MTPEAIEIEKETIDGYNCVRLVFGPHYAVEVRQKGQTFDLAVVATHHGIRVDASEVGGELEQIINALRQERPELRID
ncbi:MAG TPA: hypothetical protein VJ835_04470 [Fimbriimonadaceae bacterium]|nr:hypothetical protein [Fimbriimonadaceae bacterium]